MWPWGDPGGTVKGIDPGLIRILGEKFNFTPEFFLAKFSKFNSTTKKWTKGRVQQVDINIPLLLRWPRDIFLQ